jgi:hypothetical protein
MFKHIRFRGVFTNKEVALTKKKRAVFTYLSFVTLFVLLVLLALPFNSLLLISLPSLFWLYPLLPCIGFVFALLGIRLNLKTYSLPWAIPPIIGALFNLTLLIFIATTFNFSLSAYGACRKMAMSQEGYGVWKYQDTIQEKGFMEITFSDGTNDLSCQVTTAGPFWAVVSNTQTLVGCVKSFGGEEIVSCPEDYFGVSP